MQEVTISTGNFDKTKFGYITKAKDRDENDGILIFIPTLNDKHLNELNYFIQSLKEEDD